MGDHLTICFSMDYHPNDYDIKRTMAGLSQAVGHSVSFDKCKILPATQDSYQRQQNDYEYLPSE